MCFVGYLTNFSLQLQTSCTTPLPKPIRSDRRPYSSKVNVHVLALTLT